MVIASLSKFNQSLQTTAASQYFRPYCWMLVRRSNLKVRPNILRQEPYGTIPNAQLLTNFNWFNADNGTLLSTPELTKIAADNQLLKDNLEIHSFCNTGHWAATNWFVLSEVLQRPQVKLYAGSFVDYALNANNPVANEPNRLVRLFRSLTQ